MAKGGTIWRLREGGVAMVTSPLWVAEPPRARASHWRQRLAWVGLLSLLVHLAVIALVLMTPAPPRPELSDITPPGEVALVFQGGSNAAPSSPTPSPETSVGPPSPDKSLTAPPAGAPPPPEAAPAPAPTPMARTLQPQPPVLVPAAPASPAPASPTPASPAPSSPLPPLAMLPQPQVVPQAAVPIPQPTHAPPLPPLQPPRPIARPIEPKPPEPRPAVPPRPRVAQPRPDAFPKPLNFAFNGSILDGRGATGHAAPHDSFGPVQPGPASRSAFNSDISGDIGPDYRALLRAWLERHKYYPPQAAEEGEDGTASVRVLVHRDGSVRRVELQERSGSQWLDLGAQALFRGQRLPAFPNDALGDEQEIFVTIHYILIRG